MLAFFGGRHAPAYSASKGGIVQLTKSLAIAWAKDNIRVNAIAPGWIETPMTRCAAGRPGARNRAILDRTPMARWGTPADLVGPALFLASDAARFVTGAVLRSTAAIRRCRGAPSASACSEGDTCPPPSRRQCPTSFRRPKEASARLVVAPVLPGGRTRLGARRRQMSGSGRSASTPSPGDWVNLLKVTRAGVLPAIATPIRCTATC